MTQNESRAVAYYTKLMDNIKQKIIGILETEDELETNDLDKIAELVSDYIRYSSSRKSLIIFAKLRDGEL